MSEKRTLLTQTRDYYKPFAYPWAYEAFMQSEQMHWLWTEVPMVEDVKDWKTRLTDNEKDFLTKVFRFFTQGDIDVSSAYVYTYLPAFPQPEVRMMLSSFAAREAVHIAAYSHLIETLGMPETIYNEFLQYEEMAAKHDYFHGIRLNDNENMAAKMAAFSASPRVCSFSQALSCFLTSQETARCEEWDKSSRGPLMMRLCTPNQ